MGPLAKRLEHRTIAFEQDRADIPPPRLRLPWHQPTVVRTGVALFEVAGFLRCVVEQCDHDFVLLREKPEHVVASQARANRGRPRALTRHVENLHLSPTHRLRRDTRPDCSRSWRLCDPSIWCVVGHSTKNQYHRSHCVLSGRKGITVQPPNVPSALMPSTGRHEQVLRKAVTAVRRTTTNERRRRRLLLWVQEDRSVWSCSHRTVLRICFAGFEWSP